MEKSYHIITILKSSIMEWLGLYTKYFFKLGINLKAMASSPSGIVSGSTIVAVSVLTSIQKALLLLLLFFVLDFITGIIASWKVKRDEEKLDPSLKGTALISSEKLKLSAVKAFTYASAILGVWGIEKVFFIKTFKFENVSTEDLTVTLIFTGFCCAIEFYSIVFENFKKMGFDIAKRFLKVVNSTKKIIFQAEK
jgi:phage-related holin